MSEFNIAVMTEQGTELLAKAIAGKAKLKFTNMAVGSGEYKENERTKEALAKSTALKKQRQLVPFSLIERLDDNSVKLKAIIANDTITQGYYINEIGIYATDENKNEQPILYSIALDSFADYLPEYNGSSPATITEEYFVSINNSAEATILTNAGAYAIAEDLEDLKSNMYSAIPYHVVCKSPGNQYVKDITIPYIKNINDVKNGMIISIMFMYTDTTTEQQYIRINAKNPSVPYIQPDDIAFPLGTIFYYRLDPGYLREYCLYTIVYDTGRSQGFIITDDPYPYPMYFSDDSVSIGNGSVMNDSKYKTITGSVALGSGAMSGLSNPYNAIAIGRDAMCCTSGSGGDGDIAIGRDAMYNSSGYYNVAVGCYTLFNSGGAYNTAIGDSALSHNYSGQYNTALGASALGNNTSGYNNTAIGYQAGMYKWNSTTANTDFNNTTCIGYNAYASGSNQVQLGGSSTDVYGASGYNQRSDKRDKADIQDLTYDAVDFINDLKPVNYRFDKREDYVVTDDISIDEYNLLTESEQSRCAGNYEDINGEIGLVSYSYTHIKERDGSKKRVRLHNGFIAQEVKESADKLGFDFAGWQNGTHNGGGDVQTLAYEEFIAPIVASIQVLIKENNEMKEELKALKASIKNK